MKEPTSCVFWDDPERATKGPLHEKFELLETYLKDDNWWRYLLKCRECGQRYVFEFYEERDWEGGDDPQFSTWIPVETDQDVASVRSLRRAELQIFRPSLHHDWPKGGPRRIYWVAGDGQIRSAPASVIGKSAEALFGLRRLVAWLRRLKSHH